MLQLASKASYCKYHIMLPLCPHHSAAPAVPVSRTQSSAHVARLAPARRQAYGPGWRRADAAAEAGEPPSTSAGCWAASQASRPPHSGSRRTSLYCNAALTTASHQAQSQHPTQTGVRDGKVGVVIVDHGSRKAASNDMLVEFGDLYGRVTGQEIVEIAHMEIARPSIEDAVGRCAARGARTVVIAPYFLSCGRHIQEDIPALVEEARARHPGLQCVIADPIGVDVLMVQLINNRVAAALSKAEGQAAGAAAATEAKPKAAATAVEAVAATADTA